MYSSQRNNPKRRSGDKSPLPHNDFRRGLSASGGRNANKLKLYRWGDSELEIQYVALYCSRLIERRFFRGPPQHSAFPLYEASSGAPLFPSASGSGGGEIPRDDQIVASGGRDLWWLDMGNENNMYIDAMWRPTPWRL